MTFERTMQIASRLIELGGFFVWKEWSHRTYRSYYNDRLSHLYPAPATQSLFPATVDRTGYL